MHKNFKEIGKDFPTPLRVAIVTMYQSLKLVMKLKAKTENYRTSFKTIFI